MIPLDNVISVVESCEDVVIRFNGDPYRGMSRSVHSQKGCKSAKGWTSENVSSDLGIGWFELCIVCSELCIVCSELCIMRFEFCIVWFELCIVCSELCIV